MSEHNERPKAPGKTRELAKESLFATLAENSLAAIYLIQDGVFKYVNPRMAELVERSSDELIDKKGPQDLTHPEDWPLVRDNIQRRLTDEVKSVRYCFRLVNKSGGVIDVEVHGSRVIYNGRPAVIGTLLDITERRKTDRALEESEEKYRKLMEDANDAIMIGDPETGIVIDANKRAEQLLGMPIEKIVGMHQTQVHPKEDAERYRKVFSEHVRTGQARASQEMFVLHKSGRKIPVEISSSVIRFAGKEVIQGTFRDITERKQAEEKIRRLNRIYAVLSDINQTVVRAVDRDELFKETCRIAVEKGMFRLAWIGLIDEKTPVVKPVVHWESDKGYLGKTKISMSTSSKDGGPVVNAIRKGKHFACNDIERDRSALPWRKEAAKRGYRSYAAFPLRVERRVVGSLNIYATEPHFFDEQELRLFDEAASDISFALHAMEQEEQRKRAEEELRQTRDHLQNLLDYANAPIITWNPSYEITSFNHAFEQMAGRTADEVIGKHLRILFPDDSRKESLAKIDRTSGGEHWESVEIPIIRADGQARIALWNSANILAEDGTTVIATIAQGQDITGRKKAEEELRESEERLSGFMNSATDAFTLWDSKLNLVDLNRTAMSYLPPGVRKQDLVGKNLRVLEPDVEPSGRLARFLTVVETGEPFSIDVLHLNMVAGGEDLHVDLNVRAFKVGDGLGLITTDITDRKHAEEALARSEQRYRTMIEYSNDVIWTLDTEGNFTYINRRGEEVSGYDSKDWIGRSFAPLIPPEDLPRMQEVFLDTLAGKTRHYIVDVRAANGSTFVLSVNTAPIYEFGSVVGTVSFGRNMTEEMRAGRALRESEERYRRLVEASPDAIAVYVDNKLSFLNAAAVELFGATSQEDLIGKSMLDFVRKEDLEHAEARMQGRRDGRKPLPLTEAKLTRCDGGVVDIEMVVIPFVYGGQPATQMVARDITERKQSDQLKSDFVAMASHELRSPLAIIHGYASMLDEYSAKGNPDLCYKAAHRIRKTTTAMTDIVENLLDVTQIQAGTFKLALDTVDLSEIVTRSIESVPVSDDHTIELDDGPNLPPVCCDPDRLSVAIANLISNAAKFSPDGGTIRVRVAKKAGRARVVVEDQGIGIADEDQPHIFERFTQADMSSTRSFGGIGMGLYIARQIVEAHGGRIEVESAVGRGSTFAIDIPVDGP